ncbi:hypothetical protein AVEN_272274-1 [Araneus ventricosus]|uniref:Uncharacterized protein n=1 Tax=Araneus ventricosus TaxID=182803 RepID=A0A4Y2SKR8_ARAVE|nr:hypothetical protein AVEN_272274-1 [Araneus ventricosus]
MTRSGYTPSRRCEAEAWRGGSQLRCRPRHLSAVQNYVAGPYWTNLRGSWSDEEDGTLSLSPNFHIAPTGGHLTPMDVKGTRPPMHSRPLTQLNLKPEILQTQSRGSADKEPGIMYLSSKQKKKFPFL